MNYSLKLNRFKLFACSAISVVLTLALSGTSFADVRKTDEIGGQTMEQRGLPASVCPSIDAERAMLLSEDGTTYFARSDNDACKIASITKIMTALVALDSASLNTEITVSEEAVAVGGSSAGLWAGDSLILSDAIKGLMIPSGNDAAVAIAETLGEQFLSTASANGRQITRSDGTVISEDDENAASDAFVSHMNAKASELGCRDTLFTNPHGLDDEQFTGDLHSTASDVSKITKAAMSDQTFRETVRMESAVLNVTRNGNKAPVEVHSTDLLLGNYDGACGIKTGTTDSAGPCFVGACNRGELMYAIVLDSSSDSQRFVDARILFDWYYQNNIDYKLANSSQTVQMGATVVPVVARVALSAWLDRTVPATFSGTQSVNLFALDGNVSQDIELYPVDGAVQQGDVIGHAVFYQRNKVVAETDVVACETVPAPDILEFIHVGWERFLSLFTGAPTVAESQILNETPLIIEKS